MSTPIVIQFSDKQFHRQLKKAREYRGYKTQAAVCRKLNISRQTWSLWELGKRQPGISQLLLIASEFKLDLNFFFINSNQPGNYDLSQSEQSAQIE